MLQLWSDKAVGTVDKTFCFISALYYVGCSGGDVSALILSHKILRVETNTTGKTSFAHTVATMVEIFVSAVRKQLHSWLEEIRA
jgi:hypothetical protein